jgi:hypothetical protein
LRKRCARNRALESYCFIKTFLEEGNNKQNAFDEVVEAFDQRVERTSSARDRRESRAGNQSAQES